MINPFSALNPIVLYTVIGLGGALAISGTSNIVQYRLHAAESAKWKAEKDTLSLESSVCVSANEGNAQSIDTLQKALNTCVGQRDQNAELTKLAESIAASASSVAADARAKQRALREAGLLASASCRANAELPVCPALNGETP